MHGVWRAVAERLTSRWGARVAVLIFIAVSGALLGASVTPTSSDPTVPALPADVESVRADQLAARLPSAAVNPAVIVVTRGEDTLTPADLAAVARVGTELTTRYGAPLTPPAGVQVSAGGGAAGSGAPVIPSSDGKAALLTVPLPATLRGEELATTVKDMRSALTSGLPGLTAQLTGGPGLATDIASVFEGADVTLLAATAGIVALLLIVTYRSPILWIVPLLVVGTADQVGAQLTKVVSGATGWPIDGSTSGIASVLVFGAGTNYALLLIARYREELRGHADHREAMRLALASAAEPIVGSALTVTVSLLTLTLAQNGGTRAIGWTSALGVLVVLLGVLLVLPAALVLAGRRLFWPFIPRVGDPDPTVRGVWARLASAVTRRPYAVGTAATLVLLVMASGLIGARVGLSQTEQFRISAESAQGLDTIAAHFPAGASSPARIIANAPAADAVVAAAMATPGVASARVSDSGEGLVRVDAVLADLPGTTQSEATVEALRDAVHAVPQADAIVGGDVAKLLDGKSSATRDQKVIAPLILLVVFAILVLLLRALVAPLLLMATVVLSFLASLGASYWAFTNLFGFPALDTGVPLLAFLFLVALGVDYNIFLTTRAREEAKTLGTTPGIVRAVAVTGGVITSAGILLAAVFTVLGVLPLIALGQIGIIVGFGVLLDTLVVRTVLVPALIAILDRRVWWPSALSRP